MKRDLPDKRTLIIFTGGPGTGKSGTAERFLQYLNNDEIIKFSELLNKSFKVGGASTQEQEAGTYQLTQAMAAGKLQGDEFRSVMENAPLVADAIAKYTGKTKRRIKRNVITRNNYSRCNKKCNV